MKSKVFASAVVSASVALTGMSTVRADASDVAAGIIGGIVGGVIVNEANKNRRTTVKRTYVAPSISSGQRAANRETQTALNYFGFPAGTPDGVLGRRSRAAISQYQAHLGYPVTGQLSVYERDFLVGSYHRALAGGAATTQQIASHPQGTRGLLLVYRDQAAGVAVATAPVAVAPQVVQVAPAPQPVPAAPVTTEVVAAAPEPDAGTALPTFMGGGEALSLASHCNTVSLLTNTNGGFTTLANMGDPNTVLNEQFCLARTYAIAQGEELAAGVQGVSSDQIAAQCKGFGPVMKDHVAALSLKPKDQVLRDVSGFALSTGMAPPQLAATAKICLSVGYRTDDMDVAIGSGLILAALGEQVYGELMGHHLSQGFGATQRRDLASEWYAMSLQALTSGQPAVFAPGQSDRPALMQAATSSMTQADAGTMTAPVQPVSNTLPSFTVNQ